MRIERIVPEVVELAPRVLQPGRLYISHKYRAAVHLCCCGCGEKVVTPLSPAEWRVDLKDGRATLHPSVGNWSMTCRSHYVIRDNRVIWAPVISQRQAEAVFARDQRDLDRLHRKVDAAPNATSQPPARPHSPAAQVPESGGWLGWLKDLWRRLLP
jgi:hypothetical protein